MERKIQKMFIDEGLGFKVRLFNVPMIKVRGSWDNGIHLSPGRHSLKVTPSRGKLS